MTELDPVTHAALLRLAKRRSHDHDFTRHGQVLPFGVGGRVKPGHDVI
jgi:hypothetical protein